jgi:TolB-like protein/tetratricopeptide (TPR) repeat protein
MAGGHPRDAGAPPRRIGRARQRPRRRPQPRRDGLLDCARGGAARAANDHHIRGKAVDKPLLLQTFLGELRRRRVLRVLAIYAVTVWVALQVAEVTFEPLGLPPAAMRVLIVLALAGFPITFVLAWLIDIGPNGLLFDLPLWPRGEAQAASPHRADLTLALAVLGLLVIGIVSAVQMLAVEGDAPPRAEGPPPNTLAVMAFENFDGEAQTDYFASGLAEEILNLLADLPELTVAARSSSFRFRGQRVDVRDVAQALSVRNVLEGSVQRSGTHIQVNAQLIDGRTGFQQLRKHYRRELADVFEIQRDIALAVVAELRVVLSAESKARLEVRPTESLDAYLLFLQGMEKLRASQDEQTVRQAGWLFEQALQLDPIFPRALAGRCEVALRLYEIGNATAQFDEAEETCNRAMGLDRGQTADVLVAMARLYRFRGLAERADAALQRALAVAPSHVDAFIELGELRAVQGRPEEAEASLLRAADLKHNYWKAHEALASFYYRSKRYADAVQAYAEVTRLAPDMASAHAGSGAAYWMLGDLGNARAAWDRSLALKPSRQAFTNLGLRYYYAGHFADAVAMQREALALAPDDHRVWGRLAESLRLLGGHEAESLDAYRRAAQLAEANLAINPDDWATRGLLAVYYAYSGRLDAAQLGADHAVAASSGNAEALYYQALVRLRAGDRDGTLAALGEALARDPQYRQFLQDDPDFVVLRADPRFRAILERGQVAAPAGDTP